jgi:hypothetical protein
MARTNKKGGVTCLQEIEQDRWEGVRRQDGAQVTALDTRLPDTQIRDLAVASAVLLVERLVERLVVLWAVASDTASAAVSRRDGKAGGACPMARSQARRRSWMY